MTLKLSQKYILKNFFKIEIEWKCIYLIPPRVTIDTNLIIFQYKILNNVLYLNEKLLNLKLFLHLFIIFVTLKMKPLFTFFTLAIKQNLFGLNYKNYWTQRYFFHKIRHRVFSLVFKINKILKSLSICILYLSIICLNSGI